MGHIRSKLSQERTSDVNPSIEQSEQRELQEGHSTEPLWIQESIWRRTRKAQVQSTRSHLQLNRNSLAFKSTGVGNIPNHDVELARSTDIVVAAGTKPRNFRRKKQT